MPCQRLNLGQVPWVKSNSSMALERSDPSSLAVILWVVPSLLSSSLPSAAEMHSSNRKQLIRWSLVSPAACMNEYITDGPTHRNPLLTRSLLMLSALGDFTGTWRGYRILLTIGLSFTKLQMYLLNEPNSSIT
ncbi:hypothetical protein MLD38_014483 [Melastoma candidum]|uniref:Uncharacterized protein n=1 Tax=Melastoma candidum TaxID=119954 RepID=A0ACB9RDH4_9MYRT|nr:hypothetical protein MLD38_014483 [Melastoma candidum]